MCKIGTKLRGYMNCLGDQAASYVTGIPVCAHAHTAIRMNHMSRALKAWSLCVVYRHCVQSECSLRRSNLPPHQHIVYWKICTIPVSCTNKT